MNDFRAPRWLPGGHVQTIWPVLFSRRFDGPAPVFRRERWATPDGDFVDVASGSSCASTDVPGLAWCATRRQPCADFR